MPYYRQVGDVPRKRHVQFRQPDGSLYAEELMGVEGFSSDSSLLYHRNLPTAIVSSEVFDAPTFGRQPNHPLKPRHFKTHKLDGAGQHKDAVLGRQHLLANGDVRISYVVATEPSPLYRNAIGDECVYVEAGEAVVESVYGSLRVSTGDYVVLPTSTTHRWVPQGEVRLLVTEASGHIRPPRRYLSTKGQFLEHAPYCERDIRGPEEPLLTDGEDVEVLVQHRGAGSTSVWTRYVYATHPFDVVGWDGCLYPHAMSIHDFEPITGRVHQPPPVHQQFEGPNFVICSFVPRLFDYHPEGIPAPYNHANVDSDEVLFYTGGDFMSRKGAGIEQGSISLHPSGFTHGPQPGSVEASIGKEATDELAVMIDTFRPLELLEPALACEDTSYAWTWAGRRGDGADSTSG
jgi:homogentisate 1,2-dioxygenase